MIVNLGACGKKKIKLTIKVKFISSTGSVKKCMMHNKSDNTEIMAGIDTDEIIANI